MKVPLFLRRLYDAWMAFGKAIGKVVSFILLTVLWIIAFGPYALVFRIIALFKKEPTRSSYWLDLPEEKPEGMKYQF